MPHLRVIKWKQKAEQIHTLIGDPSGNFFTARATCVQPVSVLIPTAEQAHASIQLTFVE